MKNESLARQGTTNQRPNPERVDDENPEWTDGDARRAVPFSGLPESLQARSRGRPTADVTKECITIRLFAELVEHFRHDGSGWQMRMNARSTWFD